MVYRLRDDEIAFRSGGGVPYEAYGTAVLEAIGMGNRPMFLNDYVTKWIPAMPDVETRLRAGGRVAEIGCGVGWSSIGLAQGFPTASRFNGTGHSSGRGRGTVPVPRVPWPLALLDDDRNVSCHC